MSMLFASLLPWSGISAPTALARTRPGHITTAANETNIHGDLCLRICPKNRDIILELGMDSKPINIHRAAIGIETGVDNMLIVGGHPKGT